MFNRKFMWCRSWRAARIDSLSIKEYLKRMPPDAREQSWVTLMFDDSALTFRSILARCIIQTKMRPLQAFIACRRLAKALDRWR